MTEESLTNPRLTIVNDGQDHWLVSYDIDQMTPGERISVTMRVPKPLREPFTIADAEQGCLRRLSQLIDAMLMPQQSP